jgi:hypothetical protein
VIGQAIQKGTVYPPIRHLAATAATQARPKDYYGQIAALYNAITRRWWRYVYDPKGAEFVFIDGPRLFEFALHMGGKDGLKGYGDCDDITAASGALLRSIGMSTIIATLAPPLSPFIFTHVFLMTKPPRAKRWIAFDPVVYPKHGLNHIAPWGRIAFWDLRGNLLKKFGKFPPKFDQIMALYGPGPGKIVGNNLTGQIGDERCQMETRPFMTSQTNRIVWDYSGRPM